MLLVSISLATFIYPYVPQQVHTPLDDILPIDSPYTLTFQSQNTEEQWQIEPLPYMLSVLYIPNDIYVASTSQANQRLFMITRRIKTDGQTSDVREFYARTTQGDFLMGRVAAGRIIPYATRILVRPQAPAPTQWNHYFTDGQGSIQGAQSGDAAGCRVISITGRDIPAWQETLCADNVSAQHHDAPTSSTPQRTATAVLTTRTVHQTTATPRATQFTQAQLVRIGSFQIHNNNEKIIAPLLTLAPEHLVVAAVSGGYLAAMHVDDGALAWTYRVAGDIYGAPAHDPYHGDIVFATTNKEVHTVSAHGIRRWSTQLSDPIVADPCITPEGVVVADTAGNVSLLDAMDGKVRWTYYIGGNIVAAPAFTPDQRNIIVASQSGGINALTLDGELAWQSDNGESVLADVRGDNDMVYVVGNEGTLAAYSTQSGVQLWQQVGTAQPEWPVSIATNTIAVATTFATRIYDGAGQFVTEFAGGVTAPPLLVDGGIVLVNERQIEMRDMQGNTMQTWSFADVIGTHDSTLQQMNVNFLPTYDGADIYFADSNGRVLALRNQPQPATLMPRWYQNVSSAPFNSNTIVQSTVDPSGMLVLVSSNQQIFVLDPTTGAITAQFDGFAGLPPNAIASTADMVLVADRLHVVAYKRSDGSEAWSMPAAAHGAQQLLVSGDYVVHLYQSNAVQAVIAVIALTDGSLVWSQPYFSTPVQSRLRVDDEAVYINGLFSLALRDGSFRWFSELPMYAHVRTVSAWCGIITIKANTYGCVDALTGKASAAGVNTLPDHATLFASPASETLVVATPQHIWAYDSRTHDLYWEATLTIPIQDIVVDDTHTFVVHTDGRMTVYDNTSGAVVARMPDTPIAYETNSRYGTITPLHVADTGIFMVSNLHILGFTNNITTGDNR